jgi:hypothetical protein
MIRVTLDIRGDIPGKLHVGDFGTMAAAKTAVVQYVNDLNLDGGGALEPFDRGEEDAVPAIKYLNRLGVTVEITNLQNGDGLRWHRNGPEHFTLKGVPCGGR